MRAAGIEVEAGILAESLELFLKFDDIAESGGLMVEFAIFFVEIALVEPLTQFLTGRELSGGPFEEGFPHPLSKLSAA